MSTKRLMLTLALFALLFTTIGATAQNSKVCVWVDSENSGAVVGTQTGSEPTSNPAGRKSASNGVAQIRGFLSNVRLRLPQKARSGLEMPMTTIHSCGVCL